MTVGVDIFIGFFFIISGFLVVRFPRLIAGYNTLPEEKRKKVDIKGLSRMMRRWFIGMGVCLILGSLLFKLFGFEEIKGPFIGILLMGGGLIVLVKASRYEP